MNHFLLNFKLVLTLKHQIIFSIFSFFDEKIKVGDLDLNFTLKFQILKVYYNVESAL